MASYGKNFEWLVTPEAEDRNGQVVTPLIGARIPIGCPIEMDKTKAQNALGLQPVKLAINGGTSVPTSGLCGVLTYEEVQFRGVDEALTTYSALAMTTAPLGAAVQIVSGPALVAIFRNTVDQIFLGSGAVPGRRMVAGIGIPTPTLVIGDYLKPGIGNDIDGYWTETSVRADAWWVVTAVNNDRAEVEARLLI